MEAFSSWNSVKVFFHIKYSSENSSISQMLAIFDNICWHFSNFFLVYYIILNLESMIWRILYNINDTWSYLPQSRNDAQIIKASLQTLDILNLLLWARKYLAKISKERSYLLHTERTFWFQRIFCKSRI